MIKVVFNLAVTQISICQIIVTFLAINLSRSCDQKSRGFVQHVNKNAFDHKMKSPIVVCCFQTSVSRKAECKITIAKDKKVTRILEWPSSSPRRKYSNNKKYNQMKCYPLWNLINLLTKWRRFKLFRCLWYFKNKSRTWFTSRNAMINSKLILNLVNPGK